jgi:P27 family predicted phage terminase small subunit
MTHLLRLCLFCFSRGMTMPTPRKSEALHNLSGTRSQAKPESEYTLPPGRPKFPPNISKEAKAVFKRLCGLLESRRSLTEGDGELLRLYAVIFDRHARALAKVAEQGEIKMYVRLDSNGQPHEFEKQNLWLKICETSEKNLVAILDRLGLTPHNRAKVKPTAQPQPEKPRDPLEIELDWMPPESTTLLPAAEA